MAPQQDDFSIAELETAIGTEQLVVHYQPQMTADGKTLAAVEALVRWQHPTRGLLGPFAFIPLADSSGLIEPLGEWVLRRACRDARRWPGVTVSVNVSPLQFRRPNFAQEAADVIREEGAPYSQIELEIVETAMFEDPQRAEPALRELTAMGLRISLDDFGTGYSSLALLRRLPIHKLKIDRSFVNDIGSLQGAAIVHAIIALARAIGLKVTAEGVETHAQQIFLRSAGCHYLQGFLFSRPVPAEELDAFYERSKIAQAVVLPGTPQGAAGVL